MPKHWTKSKIYTLLENTLALNWFGDLASNRETLQTSLQQHGADSSFPDVSNSESNRAQFKHHLPRLCKLSYNRFANDYICGLK